MGRLYGVKMEPNGPSWSPEHPKWTQRIQHGTQSYQNGIKMEPKASKMNQKAIPKIKYNDVQKRSASGRQPQLKLLGPRRLF